MKMTFPHLGPAYLVARLVLKELGIEAIIPPLNTPGTLKKGKAVSPEEMCLPFKFMAGNLIEAYERGARKVVMPATVGPCRLGEYGELLREVMEKHGYHFRWVLLDTPKAIGTKESLNRLRQIVADTHIDKGGGIKTGVRALKLMRSIDKLETRGKFLAGYALKPRDCVKALKQLRDSLEKADSLKEALACAKACARVFDAVPIDVEKRPLHLTVTGEIYTLIEPAANRNLEELLMLKGYSIKRQITISWWMGRTIRDTLFGPFIRKRTKQNYVPYDIGGFAKETVSEILKSEKLEHDGVIKIMPSGCMPEIVTKAACNQITEDKGIKILNLVFDEMSAFTGYETRLEAFTDMLERRKHVFSGN